MSKIMIQALCGRIYKKEQLREDLIELNRLIKTESFREGFLDAFYEHEAFYLGLLDEADPKVRKNAVKLLACVGDPASREPLWQHYLKEETRFLRADYLEAMKAFDMKPYVGKLKAIRESLPEDEADKHVRNERRKLRELIRKEEPPAKHRFRWPKRPCRLCFIVPKGTEETAARAMGVTVAGKLSGGFIGVIAPEDLRKTLDFRVYQSALFDFCPRLIGEKAARDGRKVGAFLLEEGLVAYLEALHENNGEPFAFRVDIKGVKDPAVKNAIARDVSRILEEKSEGRLENDVSAYELEIRLLYSRRMDCRAFLKLYTLPDRRFEYRTRVLPVSMQPSRAALMMAFAGGALKDNANVLDPFCGTGILLIERAKALGYRSLYGLDIYRPALEACEENSRNAGARVQMIQRDFSDFRHEYPFDEIVTDMPRKSGNHSEKDIRGLYRTFFDRLGQWMTPEGRVLLYSEEESYIRENLKRHPKIRLIGQLPLTASGSAYLMQYGRE